MSFMQGVRGIGVFTAFFVATTAAAATSQVNVLIDSDGNASTGCSVATLTGTFNGAEQVLTTTIDTQTNVVTSVTRQLCSGGTLGSPQTVDAGGWAVGTTGGVTLIESHIPWTLLSATAPMRLGFTATSGDLSASVLQRPDSSVILFPGGASSGRRRAASPTGETNIALDGDGKDWAGIAPLAAGSASSGTSALRFLSIYAASNATDLFFRFDVQSNASAPTANDDSYSVLGGGAINITPPGVLSNDHDPNSLPLTAVLISGPQHGTLNLNADGSFTYVNDGSPAGVDSFRYKATNGTADSNVALVTLTIISGTKPAITSASSTTFTVGTAGSFTVTKTGNPTPSLSLTGALPTGVTFNATTGVISGTPAVGTGGVYNLTIKASNIVGSVTQNFTLSVNEPPTITSANAASFLLGSPSVFTVTTNGYPVPTITETGALPAGIGFNNGVFSGTPTATGTFPMTLTATNSLGTASQSFTLTVNQTPSITSANSAIATVGIAFSFTVTANGFPAPALSETGALPGGITFNPAAGLLSGTPNAGTGGVYTITFTATNSVGAGNQTFKLTINEAPAITSGNATTFTVGTAGSFTVAATGYPVPAITETGALPSGITLTGGVLSGTPAAGTGGTYSITLTASNGVGSNATQAFTLTVNEAPAITSANATTFTAGAAGSFTPTATGFPTPAISETGPLPSGVAFTGGVLSGTPAAGTGGTYTITFTATNAAGTANQTFTLTVNEAPSITSATSIDFIVNAASTFTVTTTGFPKPAITETGALPAGMLLTDNGNGTATLAGTPTVAGTFPITITATNSANTANQPFTIRVWAPPIAVPDAYAAIINTPLVAVAPGALGNDTPNGATVSVMIAPQHGGVVLNADGSFTYTPAVDYSGADSFSYALTNFAGSSLASVSITVFAPPVANGDAYQVARGLARTVAAPGVLGNDTINGATISGFTQPLNGGVTVNADGSFTYTPAPGFLGNADAFTYTLTNPAGSSTATVSLTIVDPPVANADSYNAVVNTPLAIAAPGVLGNDTVNSATISGNTNPSHGTVTLNADGSFTYTPANGYTGGDLFMYTLTNVAGNSTATVSLTVWAPPVAAGDTYSAIINTPLTVAAPGVLANDTVNGAAISGNTNPSHGTVGLNADGSFTYTPNPAYVGADSFTYTLTNPAGNSTATVSITVFQPPVAQADSYATATNTPLNIAAPGVLSNDSVNGATITAHTSAANGSLTLNPDGSFSYTPNNGFTGADTFTYTLGNVAGNSTATVTINVVPPPVAFADAYNAVINTPLSVVAPGVLGNDTLNGSGISGHTNPTNGTLTLNPDGSFTYTPNASFFGIDSFTYTLTNLGGSSTATVTITVWAPPVAVDDNVQVAKNTAKSIAAPGVLGNDTVNGATITSPTVPANGAVTLNADGSFTYTPNTGFTGSDTFQYTLTNFAGTSTATVHLTVVDVPTAADDSYLASPSPLVIAAGSGLLANDTANGAAVVSYGSPNGTEQTTVGTATPTANGTVTVNADGSFTYQANSGFFSIDTFKYVITNAAGSSTATVTINVSCPTITVSGTVGNGIYNAVYSGSVTSTGGAGTVTYTKTGALPGGLTLASDGTISGTATAVGSFPFTVTATDANGCTGSKAFTIDIAPAVHDANYTNAVGNTQAVTANYSGLASLTTPKVTYANNALVQAGDASNAAMTVTASTCNNGGTIVFDSIGEWLYTPAVGFTGTDACGYTVTSNGISASANVNIALSNPVWYVKNNVAGPGTGVSTDPFNTLAQAQTASAASDIIFVYNGDGTTTGQDAGITLKANQQLIGEGVALVVNGTTLVGAGTKPKLENTTLGNAVVTLNDGNTVKGITTHNGGIAGSAHAGFTGDTIRVEGATTSALHFTNMTGTVGVTNATVVGSFDGILIDGGSGTINIAGSVNSVPLVGFLNQTADSCAIVKNRTGGLVTISADLTSTTGNSVDVHANSGGTITFSGAINAGDTSLGTPIIIAMVSNTGATMNFTGTLTLTSANNYSFSAATGGTINVTGSNNTVNGGSGQGVNLNGVTIGTSGVTFKSISRSSTVSAGGITLVSVGGGTFTVTGDGSTAGSGGSITSPDALTITSSPSLTTNLAFIDLTGATNGINGSSFGTLNVASVSVTGSGGSSSAISLNTGTLGGTFTSVSGGSSLTAVFLQNVNSTSTVQINGGTLSGDFLVSGGNVSVSDSGGISQSGGNPAVRVDSGHTGTLSFQTGTISGTGLNSGLLFSNADGTYNFNGTTTISSNANITINAGTDATNGSQGTFNFGSGTSIGGGASTAFSYTGSRGSVTYSGSMSQATAGQSLITITMQKSGTITFQTGTLTATNGTGITISGAAGTINVPAKVTIDGTTSGIAIDSSTGTINFSNALDSIGATTATTGISFPVGLSGTASITYAGSIRQTNAQSAVTVANQTGGTVTLSGNINASTATANAISLTSNTGATISFGGTLTLTTTTGTAFNATGGGTVTATGAGSVLSSSGGAAVNVQSTTIGASDLSFQSVSATGGTNGIVLNTTGSTGKFVITGNAGTCTSLASTCTGGTIQNTTSHAVSLNSTKNPSFNFVKITNIGTSGIFGTNLTDFTLANSVIDGVNTSHSANDSNVMFATNGGSSTENNVSGVVSITNNTINNSYQHGIFIINYAGTISNLTITGNSFTSNSSATLSFGSAINITTNRNPAGGNSATLTTGNISSNTINNFPNGAGIVVIAGTSLAGGTHGGGNTGSIGSPVIINANTINGGASEMGTNGIQVTSGNFTDAFFSIGASGQANNISNVKGNGIACSKFGNNSGSGTNATKCIIAFNTINANSTSNSAGINTGADNGTVNTDTPTLWLDINNNNVSNSNGNGILSTVRSTDGTGIFHIQNNTVSRPTLVSPSVYGIRVDAGNGTEATGATVCLLITGNNTTGSTNGSSTAPGIGIRQNHTAPVSTFHIQGLSPSPASDESAGGQMEAYVNSQNPASASGTFGIGGTASISLGATFTASTCSIP